MLIRMPDYAEQFRCLAGDCPHSCCIGWEVVLDGETVALATQLALSGRVYEGLCAAGYVSADYEYDVSGEGVRVSVNSETYALNVAGELTEDESISTEVK